MRFLLISIGLILIVGGVFAIVSPRAAVLFSSGPDATSEYAKPVIEDVSPKRSALTGFAAIFLGLGVCTGGFLLKNFKVPDVHDNTA